MNVVNQRIQIAVKRPSPITIQQTAEDRKAQEKADEAKKYKYFKAEIDRMTNLKDFHSRLNKGFTKGATYFPPLARIIDEGYYNLEKCSFYFHVPTGNRRSHLKHYPFLKKLTGTLYDWNRSDFENDNVVRLQLQSQTHQITDPELDAGNELPISVANFNPGFFAFTREQMETLREKLYKPMLNQRKDLLVIWRENFRDDFLVNFIPLCYKNLAKMFEDIKKSINEDDFLEGIFSDNQENSKNTRKSGNSKKRKSKKNTANKGNFYESDFDPDYDPEEAYY